MAVAPLSQEFLAQLLLVVRDFCWQEQFYSHSPPPPRDPVHPRSLSAPLHVYQQLPLQASIQGGRRFAWRKVCDEGELVEDAPAKVIRHHRETVVGALELQETGGGGMLRSGQRCRLMPLT